MNLVGGQAGIEAAFGKFLQLLLILKLKLEAFAVRAGCYLHSFCQLRANLEWPERIMTELKRGALEVEVGAINFQNLILPVDYRSLVLILKTELLRIHSHKWLELSEILVTQKVLQFSFEIFFLFMRLID